jgi:hypothetical protein
MVKRIWCYALGMILQVALAGLTLGVIGAAATKHYALAMQLFLAALGVSVMLYVWQFLTGTVPKDLKINKISVGDEDESDTQYIWNFTPSKKKP